MNASVNTFLFLFYRVVLPFYFLFFANLFFVTFITKIVVYLEMIFSVLFLQIKGIFSSLSDGVWHKKMNKNRVPL